MSRLAEVRALFPVGSEVRCDENTLIPAHVGRRIKIRRADRYVRVGTQMGKLGEFRLNLPTSIASVVRLEHAPDLIRYRIVDARADGPALDHFVTWREVS